MINAKLHDYRVILASQSPRRKELLSGLGIAFEVMPLSIDEFYPNNLKGEDIALYLSELKAKAFVFDNEYQNVLLITADTIVWLDGEVLPKPKDYSDAVRILTKLSGRTHKVITGVTLLTKEKMHSFHSTTNVRFKDLTKEEIDYYLENFKPYDKAGAYGIQEWIGFIGIEKIEGSYFNVVGLPVQKVYSELLGFIG